MFSTFDVVFSSAGEIFARVTAKLSALWGVETPPFHLVTLGGTSYHNRTSHRE